MRQYGHTSGVVLDKHPLWLEAMNSLLERIGVEVVGRTTSLEEAVDLVREHRPDIVIAGIDDPADHQALEQLRQASPQAKIVILADETDLHQIEMTLDTGADVYCVKTAEQDDLASAIRQLFQRSIYMATLGRPEIVPRRASAEAISAVQDLTRRELEILQLVAEVHSNSQLARMLWVTEQTVKFHLSNIYRKLDVANRTEASRWAQLNGLLANERLVVETSAA
jgi:DNA-binding NarL/FixJ family response regulator